MDSKQNDRLSTTYLEERLSDRTLVERRNLIFAAAFGIVVYAYGGSPSIPWLDIKSESGLAKELLEGSLALANIYLLCMFCTYLWDDYRRWRLIATFIDVGRIVNAVEELHRAMVEMGKAVHEKYVSDVEKERIAEYRQFQRLERAYSDARNEVDLQWSDSVRRQRHSLVLVQRFRLFVLDVGVPILLGAFAVWRLTPSLLPFVMRVFKTAV